MFGSRFCGEYDDIRNVSVSLHADASVLNYMRCVASVREYP